MSLQFIYNTLQQYNDPIIRKFPNLPDFVAYVSSTDPLEYDADDEMDNSEMAHQSADGSQQQNTTASQDPFPTHHRRQFTSSELSFLEPSYRILHLRRYVYDKYVCGAPAGEQTTSSNNGEKTTVDEAPPFYTLSQKDYKRLQEGLKNGTPKEASDGSTVANSSSSSSQFHKSLKYDKMIDLLEPSLQEKQRQISQLASKPSLVKQSLLMHPEHKPKRIWESNDEELNILYDHLYRIWKEIYKHPSAWPFYKPVTEDVAPQYYDIITNPIDLSTMQKSLRNMTYTSKQEFFNDIYLMCENCRTYNTDLESPFRHKGNEIEDLARMLQNTVPDIIHVDRSGEDNSRLPVLTQQPKPLVSRIPNGEQLVADYLTQEQNRMQEQREEMKREEQEMEEAITASAGNTAKTSRSSRRSKRRTTRKQSKSDDEESDGMEDISFLQPPSNRWLQEMATLNQSYLDHRHAQHQLAFEERQAIERTPTGMARYFLEFYGYDLENDDSAMKDEDENAEKRYRVVRRRQRNSIPSSALLPEYLSPGDLIPNLNQKAVGSISNSLLTFSSLPPRAQEIVSNKTLGSLCVNEGENNDTGAVSNRTETASTGQNSRIFDLLSLDERISKQTQSIFKLHEQRLKQLTFTEEAKEMHVEHDATMTDAEIVTDPQTDLPAEAALRGFVSLFAAHSGFTHITTEARDILSEVVDHYITSLGQNLNHFTNLHTEIPEPVALLRVLGVMGKRSSTRIMKQEWDRFLTAMDGVIERSEEKYTTEASSTTNGTSQQAQNGSADRKRKRPDEAFEPKKKS